jgi:hypothetical protein
MAATDRGLVDTDLPGLFQAADSASVGGQRQYVNSVRLRLLLVISVAVTGVITWQVGEHRIDIAAIGTALGLAAAALVELNLRSTKPEELWYDGRALAESAKSLAWRFSVCGAPFEKKNNEQETERYFIEQIRKLLAEAPTSSITPSQLPVISEQMRQLRAAELPARKATYLKFRIADQQAWYSRKAKYNSALARRWRVSLLVIELVGIAAALAKATGYVNLDLAGVIAAIIAAGAAWIGLRQHSTLARAYTFAANELSIVTGRLELVDDEDRWAKEVADSEEAVSREHTMWRASRSLASS